MYKFDHRQLRVCHDELDKRKKMVKLFSSCRFILLQHILSDTEEFINAMINAELDIFALIAKPYSIDEDVASRLSKKQFRWIQESYENLEKKKIIEKLLDDAISESEKDKKSILIVDVGGYFCQPLVSLRHENKGYIKGIVEVTKFGHNRYKEAIDKIEFPIISIAESPIKTLEGRFVGMSAVTALDGIFRKFGLSLSGRHALMVGFGLIGKSVADALRARNISVMIYDVNGFPKAEAFTLGYTVGEKKELLSQADLILSSTATRAITYEDILLCKEGCVIGSVGSKKNEIDTISLEKKSIKKKSIDEFLTEYLLENGKKIYLLKEGTSINFIVQSCPEEIIDLIFAETLYCWKHLLEEPLFFPTKKINTTPVDTTNTICEKWLYLTGVKC